MLCKVYPASKVFPFLMDGTKSKNSKQRAGRTLQMTCTITRYNSNQAFLMEILIVLRMSGRVGLLD